MAKTVRRGDLEEGATCPIIEIFCRRAGIKLEAPPKGKWVADHFTRQPELKEPRPCGIERLFHAL
jgi:hypothetical protein